MQGYSCGDVAGSNTSEEDSEGAVEELTSHQNQEGQLKAPCFFTQRPKKFEDAAQEDVSCSDCRDSCSVTEARRLRAQRPSGADSGQFGVECGVGA